MLSVYRDIATEPAIDAHGRTWQDQFGQDMTYSDHVEAVTGQRLSHRDSPFSGLGRRELAQPQRVTRFADYDDSDGPGASLSAASRRAVATLRDAMGLPDHGRRESRRATRPMTAWSGCLPGGTAPTGGAGPRRVHPRARAAHEARRNPGAANDPVMGELPVYSAASYAAEEAW
jgi:hypothetical protein